MAKMGGFSAADMKKLQKQLNKIQEGNVEAFIEACAKELAARLLAKVIKRTPVGEYPKSSGKKAVHFAGVGLPKPMKKPLVVRVKAQFRLVRLTPIPLQSITLETPL